MRVTKGCYAVLFPVFLSSLTAASLADDELELRLTPTCLFAAKPQAQDSLHTLLNWRS
jgi:hypothetical protein